MNFTNTCKIPVVLTGKPYEREWETTDKTTGQKRTGSVHVIKGYMIPQNAEADPSTIREIEFNIANNKTGLAKKNVVDIMDLYYGNKEKFHKGEVYANVETYMGGRPNANGVISFFSPWVNDIEVVNTTSEDRPFVEAVTRKAEQL